MKYCIKRFLILTALSAAFSLGSVAADSVYLSENVLRLHVVAASDSPQAQQVKLQVRDAVLDVLDRELTGVEDAQEAAERVQALLPRLKAAADSALEAAGCRETAAVSLKEEEFPLRQYATFCLPSGVYHSLRVTIGQGQGQNWWCVVFPQLCSGATAEEFSQTASMEGFSEELTGSLTGEYEIRFWLLDQLGSLRNFLHRDSD